MIGRNGKDTSVFKWRSELLGIAAFDGRLHQIPMSAIALQEENSRAIGHDAAPFINSARIGDARHTLDAGTRDGIHDEEEKPGSKHDRAREKGDVGPLGGKLRLPSLLRKFRSTFGRELWLQMHANFESFVASYG